jgi:hypothetical protein
VPLTITSTISFAKRKSGESIYKTRVLRDTFYGLSESMAHPKNKQESRLQELILSAKELNIQVRTEKLLREAGYRIKSGSCRVKGQDLILIDRNAPISDQIDFLAGELAERQGAKTSNAEAASADEQV